MHRIRGIVARQPPRGRRERPRVHHSEQDEERKARDRKRQTRVLFHRMIHLFFQFSCADRARPAQLERNPVASCRVQTDQRGSALWVDDPDGADRSLYHIPGARSSRALIERVAKAEYDTRQVVRGRQAAMRSTCRRVPRQPSRWCIGVDGAAGSIASWGPRFHSFWNQRIESGEPDFRQLEPDSAMAQARRGATTRPVAREPQRGCGRLRSGCVSADRAAGRVDRVSACSGCRALTRGSVLVCRTAVRAPMMFVVTGVTHFVPRGRVEMTAMVPPRLPRPDLLVTLTGICSGGAPCAHDETFPSA